ncbi:hypothetical protein ACFYT4_35990 [Streptomyces sp. NPDC004609]|uniref:hypothetical protein n=1 Tax=Streptomyces sp. NPDC004609 TaxID=3364704 RepID=UPI00367720CB
MIEQAIVVHGPAAGQVVDVELNAIRWPPGYLMVGRLPDGKPAVAVPPKLSSEVPLSELETYVLAVYRSNGHPAKDENRRWYYLWRDPRQRVGGPLR